MSERVTFVMATYGRKHFSFLYVAVASIVTQMPDADVLIFWSDTPEYELDFIRTLSPRITFIRQSDLAPILADAGADQIVSQKMVYWSAAADRVKSGKIVFIDTDVIVVKPLDEIIAQSFDLIVTYRTERFALNSGVVILDCNERTESLLERWHRKTIAILSDSAAAGAAVAGYGGADQAALVDIIGYQNQKERYTFDGVSVLPVSCAILNEVSCSPANDQRFVYHLKGGWHPILLDAHSFSNMRPAARCGHILERWIDIYRRATSESFQTFVEQMTDAGTWATDGIGLVADIAHFVQADRFITLADPAWSRSALLPKATAGLPAAVLPARSERQSRKILEGAPAVFVQSDDPTVWQTIFAKIPLSPDIRLLLFPCSAEQLREAVKFRFYRWMEVTVATENGPLLCTLVVPTFLDYSHMRRNPDWAGLTGR